MLAGAALVVVGGAAVAGGAAVMGVAAAGGGGGLFLRSRHKQKKLQRKHEKMMALVQSDWEQISRSSHTDDALYRPWPRAVADLQTATLPAAVSFELAWSAKPTLASKRKKCASMLIDCNAEKELFLLVSAFDASGKLVEEFTAASLAADADQERHELPPVEIVSDDFGSSRQSLSIDFSLVPDSYDSFVVSCVYGEGNIEHYDAKVTLFEGRECKEFDEVFAYQLDQLECTATTNAYVVGRIARAPKEADHELEWTFDAVRRPLCYAQRFVDLPCRIREHGAPALPVIPSTALLQIEGADLFDNVHTTWFGFDRLGHLRCAVATNDPEYEGSNSKVELASIFSDPHLNRVVVVACQPDPDPFQYQVKVKVESGAMLPTMDQRHVMIMGNETWLRYRLQAMPLTGQALFELTRRPEGCIVPYPVPGDADLWHMHLLGYAVQPSAAFQGAVSLTGVSPATVLSITVQSLMEYAVKENHGLSSTCVNVVFQDQKAKTSVDKNSGSPSWNENITFNLNAGWSTDPVIYFELLSEKGVLMAETAFNLACLPLPYSDMLPLYYGSEKKGRLNVKVNCTPDTTTAMPLAIAGSKLIEDYSG